MSEPKPSEPSLENEIAILRDLIQQAGNEKKEGLEDTLAVLDSVADATPKLATALKNQREMARSGQDPIEILRQALAELEQEWPELREVKEQLRGNALPSGGEA
jgi:DNA repair exonuclease SbcCD ATPase subunit